jgi:hypothetical protein
MNATLGSRANTGEVDFPGGIKSENIMGAYVYKGDGSPIMVTDADGNSIQEYLPNPTTPARASPAEPRPTGTAARWGSDPAGRSRLRRLRRP